MTVLFMSDLRLSDIYRIYTPGLTDCFNCSVGLFICSLDMSPLNSWDILKRMGAWLSQSKKKTKRVNYIMALNVNHNFQYH